VSLLKDLTDAEDALVVNNCAAAALLILKVLAGDGETIVSPKPPLPEARFRVLDQRAVDTLAKLRQSAGSSHLAMGVFYWKHGLIEESEREFQALALANPNSTAVAELLASIRSILRR